MGTVRESSGADRGGRDIQSLRRWAAAIGALLVAAAAAVLGVIAAGQAIAGRAIPPAARAPAPTPPRPTVVEAPPQDDWTPLFRRLEQEGDWSRLLRVVGAIRREAPKAYDHNHLGWLHARAAEENGDVALARKLYLRFTDDGAPFAPLALDHLARLELRRGRLEAANAFRRRLIREFPTTRLANQALDDLLDALEDHATPKATLAVVEELQETVPAERQRDLSSHLVAVFVAQRDYDAALGSGLRLLDESIGDDAAERVARALDRPELLSRMSPEQIAKLGEALRTHRYFDRAVVLLTAAREHLPRRRAELGFAIGRAEFFAEHYDLARTAYLEAATAATSNENRARYLFHAARAAHLMGDTAGAQRLASRAIAVPGRFDGTAAALGKRIQLELVGGHDGAARRDLATLRRLFPRDRTLVQSTLLVALYRLEEDRGDEALSLLTTIPHAALERQDVAELAYWRGRVLQDSDPERALTAELTTLRSTVPTHFAHFASELLAREPLDHLAQAEAERRRREAAERLAAGDAEEARALQTDALLLAQPPTAQDLQRLAEIYRQLPRYRDVLELEPLPLPAFPLEQPTPGELLMAMGLFGDAQDSIPTLFPAANPRSTLTQALAFGLAAAPQRSIRATEILVKGFPDDYVPALLPAVVQRLLYPRYFYPIVLEQAHRHHADPRLVLSIMREESRFDTRAHSAAAARGLMQFVITTARQVGSEIGIADLRSSDLYQPEVIVQLGARYLGTLLGRFDGNLYATAAAYNAGPNQAAEWLHVAPRPTPEFFLSTINFDETKNYVRKVMNSYLRYEQTYGPEPPTRDTGDAGFLDLAGVAELRPPLR